MGISDDVIVWNGKSSGDLNVIVEHHANFGVPVRKREVISVPGRNGDIVLAQDAYENVEQEYDLAVIGIDKTLPENIRAVMEWLYKPTGYARLEDSFNPDVYREAYFVGDGNIENRFSLMGRATVTFSCKPQRFLRTGEKVIKLTNGYYLRNPSIYTAKPLITIKGTGSAVLTVGNCIVNISDIGTEIDIDSYSMSAYYGTTNKNNKITLTSGYFPELREGNTAIRWTGSGVTSVSIIPRWWIL